MIRTTAPPAPPHWPTRAPRCGDCHTRYCGRECQKQHWKEGGHNKDICKKIKRGGGAEQYYADKKCAEAVAVAVEECADDTQGQTCYICTEALHWKTKEGLVRGCACRGTAGFAHVSCLGGAGEDFGRGGRGEQFGQQGVMRMSSLWHTCSLCEQEYHGVVAALGWACWKTYVGRPEMGTRADPVVAMRHAWERFNTMGKHYEDALPVMEAQLSTMRRRRAPEKDILVAVRVTLASTYDKLGRLMRPCACGETYTLAFEALGESTLQGPSSTANKLREASLASSEALRRSQDTDAQNDARGATRSRRRA